MPIKSNSWLDYTRFQSFRNEINDFHLYSNKKNLPLPPPVMTINKSLTKLRQSHSQQNISLSLSHLKTLIGYHQLTEKTMPGANSSQTPTARRYLSTCISTFLRIWQVHFANYQNIYNNEYAGYPLPRFLTSILIHAGWRVRWLS